MWLGVNQLFLLISIIGIIDNLFALNYSQHGLFWGGTPNIDANITTTGSWLAIEGASVVVNIDHASASLVTYDMIIEGLRIIEGSPLPREGNADTVQVRCTVDGIPYRYSSSFALTYLVEQIVYSKLSSSFVANLTAGNHNITLQWKKTGNSILKWRVSSSGVNSGFSMSVLADAQSISYLHEMNDVYLYAIDTWKPLTQNLSFFLSTTSSVSIGYSFIAQPQTSTFIKDRNYEYVTSRIVVDGVAYTDGSESRGTSSWNPLALGFKGTLTLPLLAGKHTTTVQWRKMGSVFKSWGSSPSYLDGFASSRNLFVLVNKFEPPQIDSHERQIFHGTGDWVTVNNQVQYFSLVKESAVLITYALPVSQFENFPNYDADVWIPLSRIDARLLVDNIPYTYTGGDSLISTARTMSSLFGTLPLVLPAGTHSIALQWRADSGFNWTTLMDLDDGFAHGEKLLTFITSENAKPSITAPAVVVGVEDVVLDVLGIEISDVDELLAPGMTVRLNITVLVGTLHFPNLPLLANDPEYVHGADSSSVIFVDTIAIINAALSDVKYQSPLDWNGNDTFYLVMSDEKNLGFDAVALQDEQEMTIVITAVDDQFVVTTPAYQEFSASGNLSFEPIGLADVDSPNSVFRVQMSLSCGFLSLMSSEDVTFLMGDGVNDTAVDFQGVYESVVSAFSDVTYTRDPSCNSMAMDNFMVIKVINTDNLSQNVTITLPLIIERINAPPEIITDDFPRFMLTGLLVDPTRDMSDVVYNYTQYPIGISEVVDVGADKNELILRNKFKKSSMSELSVLESEYYSYIVSLQYQVIPITMLTSSYLLNDTLKTVVLSVESLLVGDGYNFTCVLNTRSFPAIQTSVGVFQCEVSYIANEIEVNRHRPVWIQLVYLSLNTTYEMRSSYLPLFMTDFVVVNSVTPNRLYASGQSLVRVRTSNPAVVENCFFGETVVVAFYSSGNVVCRAPEMGNVSMVLFRIGSADQHIVSEAFPLSVFSSPVISNAFFEPILIVGSPSNRIQLVVKGSWSDEELEYVQSAVCVVSDIRLPSIALRSGSMHCDVDYRSWMLFKNGNVSLFAEFDSQKSNVVNILASFSASSLDTNSSIAVDDFYPSTSVLESSTVTLYGHSFLNATKLKCVIGSNVADPMKIDDSKLMCRIPVGSNASDTLSLVDIGKNTTLYSGVINIVIIPEVSAIIPSKGSVSGGDEVIVIGSKFDSSLAYQCLFGEYLSPAVWLSDLTLSCLSPPSSPVIVSFSLLCDNIFAGSSKSIEFSYTSTPTVYSISPSISLLEGNQMVTVTGIGFLSTDLSLACEFGETITDAEIVSDSLLICWSPSSSFLGEVSFHLVVGGVDRSRGSMPFRYVLPLVVNSVSPSQGSSIGGTTVSITGGSFVQAVETSCVFGDIVVPATVLDSEHLDCVSPVSTPGVVILSLVMDNFIVLSNVSTFSFTFPLVLESLNPSQGTVNGNTSVVLQGAGFNFFDGYSCRFGEYSTPAEFVSSSEMVCRTPIHPYIGTVAFSLTNSYGIVMSNVLPFSFVSGTVVTGITPSAGPIGLESLVTVSGSGFFQPRPGSTELSEAMCQFGDIQTAAIALSDNVLSCLSPVSVSEKTVKLNIYFNDEKLTEDEYFYRYVKTIVMTDVAPKYGWSGTETLIVVKASSFSVGSQLECVFDSNVTSLAQYLDENTIQCYVPVGLNGRAALGVTVNGYLFQSDLFFTSMPELEIQSIVPSLGSSLGGTNVSMSVSGVDFDDILHCWFGNSIVSASLSSEGIVTCVTPAHIAATVVVMLQVNGVDYSESTVEFTFAANIAVDSVIPNVGSMSSLTTVTVWGTGFTSNCFCLFGATKSEIDLVNSSVVTCSAPKSDSSGAVLFKIGNEGGDVSTGDFFFRYVNDIFVNSVFPQEGSTLGATSVIVKGNGFSSTNYTQCHFGSSVVDAIVINSTDLMCLSPSSTAAGLVTLTISVDGQATVSSDVVFSYQSVVEVTSFWPSTLSTHGGTNVTIYGTGFTFEEDLLCQFDGSIVPAVFISVDSVACTSPSHILGTSTLGIFSNEGVLLSKELFAVEYVASGGIKLVTPTFGSIAGGENVRITGHGFLPSSLSTVVCLFGNISVAADVISDYEIKCISPSIDAPQIVDFKVTVNGDISHGGTVFTFFADIIVSSCNPSYGLLNGGSVVTVFGEGFADSLSLKCFFGYASTPAYFVNSSAVRCLSPSANESGLVNVSVGYGQSSMVESNTVFNYIEEYTVVVLTPLSVFASGGQNVSLMGLNISIGKFVICRFGQVEVTALVVDNIVKCVTPALAVGLSTVSVLVDDVVVKSDLVLSVMDDVIVHSIAPQNGFLEGGNVVSVVGAGFDSEANLVCKFGNLTSIAVVDSNVGLHCVVPASESEGSTEFHVVVNEQALSFGSIYYRYIAPLIVYSSTPSRGSIEGGTLVYVNGESFSPVDGVICEFDGTIVEASFLNSSVLICTSPPSTVEGEVQLSLKVNGLAVTDGLSFTYRTPVVMADVTPTFSSTLGGGSLTVTGSGFTEDLMLYCVVDNDWVSATVLSSTMLTCVIPSHSEGIVSMLVMSADRSMYSSELSFEYGLFPSVTSVIPVGVQLVAGDILTIIGWDFDAGLVCQFDAMAVLPEVLSDSKIQCIVPDGLVAGSNVLFEILAFNETLFSQSMIVFSRYATAGTVVPSFAPIDTSVSVRVVGSQFESSSTYSCSFGEINTTALVFSDTELLCNTPQTTVVSIVSLAVIQMNVGVLFSVPFSFVEVPLLLSSVYEMNKGVILTVNGNLDGRVWDCVVDSLLFSSVTVNDTVVICNIPYINFKDNTVPVYLISDDGFLVSNEIEVGRIDTVESDAMCASNEVYSTLHEVCINAKSMPLFDKITIDRSWFRKSGISAPRQADSIWSVDYDSLPPLAEISISRNAFISNVADTSNICTVNSIDSCFSLTDSLDAIVFNTSRKSLRYVNASERVTDFSRSDTNHGSDFLVISDVYPVTVSSINSTWITVRGSVFTNFTKCFLGASQSPLRTIFVTSMVLECLIPPLSLGNSMIVELTVSDGVRVSLNSISLNYDFFKKDFKNFVKSQNDSSSLSNVVRDSSENLCASKLGCDIQIVTEDDLCSFTNNGNDTTTWMAFQDVEAFGTTNLSFCQNQQMSNVAMQRRANITLSRNADVELSVIANGSSPVVTVFLMEPHYVSIVSLAESMVTFLGTGFSPSSNWCFSIQGHSSECYVGDLTVSCLIPQNLQPGMFPVSLLRDCTDVVYTDDLTVLMGSISADSSTEIFAPSVVSVFPLSGTVMGGTFVTIQGSNMNTVRECVFVSEDKMEYFTGVFDAKTDSVACLSPEVLASGWAHIEFVLSDNSRMSSGYFYKYFDQPDVHFFSLDASTNNSIIVTGANYPLTQSFCNLSYSDGTSVLSISDAISTTEVRCVGTLRYHFSTRVIQRVGVSFNGVDFVFTDNFVALKFDEITVPNEALASTYSDIEPYSADQAYSLEELVDTPTVLSTSCDSNFRANLFVGSLEQNSNYSCFLNGEYIGRAQYLTANMLGCAVGARSPGTYELSVLRQDSGLAGTFNFPFNFILECGSRPKIYSGSLLPQSKVDGKWEVNFLGINIQENSGLMCKLDGVYSSAAIDSQRRATCLFEPVAPGMHSVSLLSDSDTLLSYSVCFTADFVRDGGDFASVKVTEEACIGDVLIVKSSQAVDGLISVVRDIRSFAPRGGLTSGGTAVEVLADGINYQSQISCLFGSASIPGIVISRDRVACYSPSQAAGNTSLVLINNVNRDSWTGAWFYFYPLVSLRLATPAVIDSRGGTLLRIETRNRLETGVRYYCHINSNVVPAFVISDYTVSCVTPLVTLPTVNVSLGSLYEPWSDSLNLVVSGFGISTSNVVPSHGSIFGGTTVVLSVPLTYSSMKVPYCLFGKANSTQARILSSSSMVCESPPNAAGMTQVSVFDASFDNSPVFYVGIFSYEVPAEITALSPSVVNQGEGIDMLVFGTNFIDSPELSCVVQGSQIINARWLSSSMILCAIPDWLSVPGQPVQVHVSNNGHDMSESYRFLDVVTDNSIREVAPTRSFITGGSEVVIEFRQDFSGLVNCRFGNSAVSTAYQVESNVFVCIAPPFEAGSTKLEVLDAENGFVMHSMMYEFVPIPVLRSANADGTVPVVLSGIPSPVSWFGEVSENYFVRFRSLNGSLAESKCASNEKRFELKCIVLTSTLDEILFMDVSVNNRDFMSGFASVQVFQPSKVMSLGPLAVPAVGGVMLTLEVDQFRSGFATKCVFSAGIDKWEEYVAITSNTTALCKSPSLPLSLDVFVQVEQNDIVVFGPVTLEVIESMVITNVFPTSVFAGVLSVVEVSSLHPLLEYPARECVIQGVRSAFQVVNSTVGVCNVQPLAAGDFELTIRYVDDMESADVLIERLKVVDVPSDFAVSSDTILEFSTTNITITSKQCVFQPYVHCYVPAMVTVSYVNPCELVCSISTRQDLNTIRMDVCDTPTCDTPLYSQGLRVLSSVSVVTAYPSSGPVQGFTPVTLFGSGFVNDDHLECQFGNATSRAVVLTSATISCRSPPAAPGVVPVNILRRGKIISKSVVTYEYFPLLSQFSLSTLKIASIGGTKITLTTQKLNFLGPFDCRFNEKYVPALIVSDTKIECESPAFELLEVEFALSSEHSDVSPSQMLEVVLAPTVLFLDPVIVVSDVSTRISVWFGESILNSSIQCHLDGLPIANVLHEDDLLCVIPDGLPVGEHLLSLQMNGAEFYSYPILSRSPYAIQSVVPLASSTDFASTVTIVLTHQDSGANYVSCCFGDLLTPAMLVSGSVWQCHSPLVQLGRNTSASYSVGLARPDGFCEFSGFDFKIFKLPDVKSVSGGSGSTAGGTSILLEFKSPLEMDLVYCRVALSVFLGQILDPYTLLCITPDPPATTAGVEISVNGVDFVQTGSDFSFTTVTPNSEIATESSGPAAVIYFVSPDTVGSSSQGVVKVYGANLRTGSTCMMGTLPSVTALTTTFVSEGEIDCTMPVHAIGTDNLYIRSVEGTYSAPSVITFIAASAMSSNLLTSISPLFGPIKTTTVITVNGVNLDLVNGLLCVIGSDYSYAFHVTSTSCSCTVPTALYAGNVTVQLANVYKEVLPNSAVFTYIRDAEVDDLNPKKGTFETQLIVTGYGFSTYTNLTCLIGDVPVETHVLSDTQVLCVVPLMDAGTYSVTFQTNGQHPLTSGLVFLYLELTKLTHLYPFSGPSMRGNTTVSVYGSGFTNSINMFCIFDTSPVPAVYRSEDRIECVTPAHAPGYVNVSVMSDGSLVHLKNESLLFLYTPDVSVYKITPEFGYTSGEFPVFVFGSNFLNTTGLGCQFADMKSRGVFLTESLMVCLAPSPLGRPELFNRASVALEVTVNGADYSNSGIQFAYSQPCDQGFFCPGMTRQLCPNGTYCPVNSRNFTLCEPGTFQPKEGQTGCALCPIGYICPDHGMSRPVNCPPGLICDSMGLRTSAKLCPAGQYCLNGTKAFDVASFNGSANNLWVTDYVTGVVTFNQSAQNWDYTIWPYPAVGKSRSQHPPEPSCDGLVCYPGSTNVLAEAPFPCPIGHYCRAGVGTQIPMPKNFSSPQRCFDGFFCPRGSKSPEGSGPCPNGHFCPTQIDAIPCPQGHYCPGVGNRDPIECYPGTYNPLVGQANCTVCPAGFICPGWGVLLPELCPAGFVCMALGVSFPVVQCPQGYRCEEGTRTLDPSAPTVYKPIVCEAGQFCLGGVSSTTTIEWIPSQSYGGTHPQVCSEGTYCQSGAYLSSGSGLCFEGHYCPPNSSFPISTPLGNFASGLGSVAPTLCYPGTYAPLIAQIDCLLCPSGNTCTSYGTYIPSVCEAGTYRSQVDSVTCTQCPTGTYSFEVGSPDLSMCLPCPKGRICGIKKMVSLSDSSYCPPGYICGYGTDRSSQFQHLTPAGFHTAQESSPEVQYDSVCQPGYYCPRGTPTYLQFGGKCPVGYYCPQSTPAAITADVKCPVLTTSLSALDTLQGCRISEINVCDKSVIDDTKPMEDTTYYSSYSYTTLDDTGTFIEFDSSLSAVTPTGEIEVVRKIYPTNISASSDFWQNDTIEAFRTCPQYGSADGKELIMVIGRNFRDSKLNYCKFRACNSANLGRHPRRCKNQILSPIKEDLAKAGNVSMATFITRAKYISPTRMECETPEFIFDYNFHPNFDEVFYNCSYINNFGVLQEDSSMGNYSYVRQCGKSDTNCLDLPFKGLEYFTSTTFPCTAEESLEGVCADKPELGYMFNPCMTGEVIVEVTNDGEHYSGGVELAGTSILSTVRYGDGNEIYNNFKNFTVPATFAVYTYIYREFWYQNDDILLMERKYCGQARYSEEAEREREKGWFKLQLQEAAHMHVDFSFLPDNLVYGEHYRMALFMLPSRCAVEICSSARVRLSPEEFLPCRKPAEFSYWFQNAKVYNVKNNITIYALDDLIFKLEIHILNGLYAAYQPLFKNTSIVRIAGPSRTTTYDGLPMSKTATRQLSQYISFEEQRITAQWFFCAVVYFSDTLSISQALNLPPTYTDYQTGRALLMYNVSTENNQVAFVTDNYDDISLGVDFWLMPATTADNSKELLDAYFETFHDTSYVAGSGYVFDFQTLLIGYLPYFSNCHTFDSYIPIWLLLEGKECELPDIYPKSWHRYKFPPLPDQDDVVFVGPFDFLSFPVADWCERSLTCHYEEVLEIPDATPRWFEVETGTALFQMIRYPMSYENYTGRASTHIGVHDAGGGAAVAAYQLDSGDNFIDVAVDHSIGDLIPGCVTLCFARSYLLTIAYYQLDLHTKKIISISLAGDAYDFDTTNTEYELAVSYQALGFIDLVLNFAFPLSIFIVMFVVLGFATGIVSFIGWAFCRATTLLQNPPQLKIMAMLALVVPPALGGVTIAVILIWILTSFGNYCVNGVFFTDPNSPVVDQTYSLYLDQYHLAYANIGTQFVDGELENARAGRIGSVFLIVGFCCFLSAAKLYFPKEESKREREIAKKRTELAHKRELWDPVLWKKANFMFSSVVFSLMLVMIVEFSFWGGFGDFFYSVLIMFIIFGEVLVMLIEMQLQDKILVAPLNAGYGFATQLVTFGSPDFLAFLLSYFLGFAMASFQRVFQNFYMDAIFGAMKFVVDKVISVIRRFIPKYLGGGGSDAKEEAKEYKKRDVEGIAETGEDAESVEPIIDYFCDICSDTMILFYFPYFVYLFMQYRDQIQIPILYGIRQSDMMIYLVFQLFSLVSQPLVDVFNHAQCELFHGWKIYEYLVYSRYRFLQRETRWKGMENSLDECIEEGLRKLDQMCFSSQYYLMLTAQVNGIIYLILAFECWLRVGYSPFSDSGFFVLLGFIVGLFIVMEWVVVALAIRLKVWKIKHENTAWHLIQKEEDELDIPGWDEVKGASTEAYVMNQRITSETFRYKFLNYNRTWLINQLPQLLTPRTMRRSRPYLINQFARIINAKREDISDDSDKDKEKKFGPVALTAPSRNIIRWWLGKARRRLRLRSIVDPLIKRARGSQCEQCLSRKQLQIEYEVDIDKMAEMYDRTYPGDEEVDQVQWKSFWVNNQRYHTICLACLTKGKELATRNALKGADATLFDDDQEDYPDWGPVFLTAASKAMLLNWYRKAQRLRAGKRGRRQQKVAKAISDDEGEDVPLQWLKDMAEITPSTHAIAIKWMRTARARLQKKAGRGYGEREEKEEEVAPETFKSGNKSKVMRK